MSWAMIIAIFLFLVVVQVGRDPKVKWTASKTLVWLAVVEAIWGLFALMWESRFGSAMHQADADVALKNLAAIPSDAATRLGWAATSLGLDKTLADLTAGLSGGNFSGLVAYWPLVAAVVAVILLIGLARWVWGHTQILAAPAATAGSGGIAGSTPTSIQDRLINLGLGAAALGVSAIVIILVLRWSGIVGAPTGRPSLDTDRRTLAAKLADADEFRVYQGVNFLPELPALDTQGHVTITVAMAEGMLINALDQLRPIEILDQRAKTPVTQDVRDYVVSWVEGLTLRLNQARIDPLTVPGYMEVYLKARTLEARGLAMQGSHQWTSPPPVGGEVEKTLKLANRVAALKVWVEDLEARNADSSVPPPTLKERQEAQAEAKTILADCESSRLMLNLGAQVPFAQAYDPVYADLLWNSQGDGLCNWAQALGDRLR